jgi:hypothetical protein
MDAPTPPPNPPRGPLDYRTPIPEDNPNRPSRFVLRALVGFGLGVVGLLIGGVLVGTINPSTAPAGILLFFGPIVLLAAIAIGADLRLRRFGFATGIIAAPFLIVIGIGCLLFFMCGGLVK